MEKYLLHKQITKIIPDPFSIEIVDYIKSAVLSEKAFSVIRIGDGEINLLSYNVYSSTPYLNSYVVEKIVAMQKDSFAINSLWKIIISDLMMESLLYADIIGVIGLWRQKKADSQDLVKHFVKDPRGISGHYHAIDHMLYLADQGVFNNKILTSAHLYFSILENLNNLISVEKKILLFLIGMWW
ncbi:hypothetical protein VKI21_17550 [Cyanobacterium aponinum UTEX 3222]|uniref:GT-D fold domain-containing protein n=1 Tax=Cyanobacterium aponinum TaxID=379064 RepID=UPI002B4BD315|nr:hypothetical protein [Cyanobacterium aponinum]WRL37709.1 hypothetical protein VKI22_13925 [Cyanobacterium aponinum UTEX 3221]WRL41820.1 hypothetical protein VKI21_17550 [Cyanobacterium aponinum UTEX 3222]